MATLWFKSFDQMRDVNGVAYPGAIAYFYNGGTTTPRVVYTDNALTTPLGSSVTADSAGMFPAVFLPSGTYNFLITSSTGVQLAAGGPVDPAPTVTSGGGGTVDPTLLFSTGDVMWIPASGTKTAWVRLNGRTIGNAASGATERANADTSALFAFLWANNSNTVCPVSGGRGASAAADYAANKTIQLIDLRGRAAVGLDDMGNSAANVLQVSTTVTTVNASTSATVASASGLFVGMYIVSTNIPTGTTVTAISGTTVTMSNAATAGAAGVAARFSVVADAQVPGSAGGDEGVTLTTQGLPTHTHTGTTSTNGAHTHNYNFPSTSPSFTPGAGNGLIGPGVATATTSAGDHTHTFTSDATGGGLAHNNVQPAVVGTFYQKL
jgi:microcystin-dependent protein